VGLEDWLTAIGDDALLPHSLDLLLSAITGENPCVCFVVDFFGRGIFSFFCYGVGFGSGFRSAFTLRLMTTMTVGGISKHLRIYDKRTKQRRYTIR
jgi:hypothetical protein